MNNEEFWNMNYKLAKDYYEEHGDLLIPQSYKINGFELGLWINAQRQAFKKQKLSQEYIILLEQIKMVWNVRTFNLIKKIESLIGINKPESQELLDSIVNEIIEYTLIDLVNHLEMNVDIGVLIERIKQQFSKNAYGIFVLHLFGIDDEKLSKLYNLPINKIQEIELKCMKFILKEKEKIKKLGK